MTRTPRTPALTPLPAPSITPLPPTPTPGTLERLTLGNQEQICEAGLSPEIQVVVLDEKGKGMPGVVVWLVWSTGSDRAVTGLKPELGAGYVDFDVVPAVDHALSIGGLGFPIVTDLQVVPCHYDEDEEPVPGSWRVVIEPADQE